MQQDADPELTRLIAAENSNRARYLRLSQPNGWPTDSDVLKIARILWADAAAAVREYQYRPLAPSSPRSR